MLIRLCICTGWSVPLLFTYNRQVCEQQRRRPSWSAPLFSLFSSPEPKAHRWANSIPVTPASVRRLSSVVCQHFQTSSPLKLLGQLNSYFICRLLRMGERKFAQMVLVTWPRWPSRPYMVKTLKKSSSPEPEGRWPWDLVCSIGVVGPTKFVQMMILGWPWPT